MDKFAIDLDQVLNDFEYSELTDQNNATRNLDTHTSTSTNHNNVTKHSINNVFHSLNEYLNTNINVADMSQVENNFKESTSNNVFLKPSATENIRDDKDLFVSSPSRSEEKCISSNVEVPITSNFLDDVEKPKDPKNGIEVDLMSNSEVENHNSFKDEEVSVIDKENFPLTSESVDINPLIEVPIDSRMVDFESTTGENELILCQELSNVKIDGITADKNTELYRIGFRDDLNLDDSDINKLLAEFEDELGVEECDILEKFAETQNVSEIDIPYYPEPQNSEPEIPKGDKDDKNVEENDQGVKQDDLEEIHEIVQKIHKDNTGVENNYSNVHKNDLGVHKNDLVGQHDCLDDINKGYLIVKDVEELQNDDSNKCQGDLEVQQVGLEVHVDDQNIFKEQLVNKEGEDEPNVHQTYLKVHEENLEVHEYLKNSDRTDLEHEEGLEHSGDLEDRGDVCKVCVNNESLENAGTDLKENIEMRVPSLTLNQDRIPDGSIEESNMKITNEKESPAIDVVPASRTKTYPECDTENEIETEDDKIKVYTNTGGAETAPEECDREDYNYELGSKSGGDNGMTSISTVIGDNNRLHDKEECINSSCRPQNLSLNGSDGESQRKINLIGGPGSTPYNNVYVNEELNKFSTVDSDTDCSTSSSNSFSDASSVASTASTEEMKDDNDVIVEKPSISTICDDAEVAIDQPEVDNNDTGESSSPAIGCEDEVIEGNEVVISSTQNSDLRTESDENHEIIENEQSEPTPEVDLANASNERQWLGKEAPLWIPDSDTTSCLHCDMKFTVLKRRHHCRACGLVLCSKCCYLRFKLEYLDAEARVCNKCHDILNKDTLSSSSSDLTPDSGNSPHHRPNPNNPLEYCSTISPLQQVGSSSANPPAIMVPVGVLKRKGSNKGKSNKSVMFCDGIRPGSDLTNLDNDFNYNNTKTKKLEKSSTSAGNINRNLPIIDAETNTFIPKSENSLPPLVTVCKTDISYTDCSNNPATVDKLKHSQHTFAIHLSLYVHVKIVDMSCCINKMAWCFCTEGMINVGQDEIVILLEYIDEESFVPKDVFYHINNVYTDAIKGASVKELGLSLHNSANFLDSKNHAGFVYIRPTFQCVENIIKPKDPYLIGILIHRWETPWAKLFPLRLILRLGAEYRYYPSPIISTRHRDSVFVEIGHTIINLLADFRNFSYTIPQIRGLTIHMEDKNTTVTIPINRYDQVIKSLNNTSDHILAFAGVFSQEADSHLVCIQDTQGIENCYSTHAINIQNKPRKITGASFIVFNGALKSSSGLTAKSNIVEDGLMIQVMPEHMQQIREKLRAMKDHTIPCGCVNADSDETVNIVWGENDVNFNVGVTSGIDGISLSGIPSIRVHNGKNHVCVNGNRIIRWTEVFIIQNGEDSPKNQDPVDISRLSESLAKATCDALVKYLDLLLTNNCQKLAVRVTLQEDNVSYVAGSNGTKLPPIYMKSLDDELIPVLHRITSNDLRESAIVLELIFRILNV